MFRVPNTDASNNALPKNASGRSYVTKEIGNFDTIPSNNAIISIIDLISISIFRTQRTEYIKDVINKYDFFFLFIILEKTNIKIILDIDIRILNIPMNL